jgi:tRNA (guanine-N7-)-methyltransferase
MGGKLINIISFMKRERKQSEESELDEGNRKIVKEDRLIPKKKDYRMRAHINPLNTTPFPFPAHHTFVDWKAHYPLYYGGSMEENHKAYCNTVEHPSFYEQPRQYPLNGKNVDIIDVGCGYGGLLFGLAPLFLGRMILGMEIRDKLVNFVSEKIRGYRIQNPGKFDHISVVRTNTMRHLCQYFPKASLEKIFICFPDPHFKAKNYRRRIINTGFLS